MYRSPHGGPGPERRPIDRPIRRTAPAPVDDEPSSGPSRLKWLTIGAVVTAAVGWFVPSFSPYEAIREAREAIRPDPPAPTRAEAIVAEYMEQTRTAAIWARPPVMYPQGAEGMEKSFAAYDPRRAHRYRRLRHKFYIPDVIHVAPVFAGRDIEIFGRIVTSNLMRPISTRLGEWVIQLAPMTVERGLVYCRVTAPLTPRPFPAGEHRVARGMVIASGAADLARGGFENMTYMACSAVRRPYGELGQFTRFVERAGIDLVVIYKRARGWREAAKLWEAEVRRALKEDPTLVALIPEKYWERRLPLPTLASSAR